MWIVRASNPQLQPDASFELFCMLRTLSEALPELRLSQTRVVNELLGMTGHPRSIIPHYWIATRDQLHLCRSGYPVLSCVGTKGLPLRVAAIATAPRYGR